MYATISYDFFSSFIHFCYVLDEQHPISRLHHHTSVLTMIGSGNTGGNSGNNSSSVLLAAAAAAAAVANNNNNTVNQLASSGSGIIKSVIKAEPVDMKVDESCHQQHQSGTTGASSTGSSNNSTSSSASNKHSSSGGPPTKGFVDRYEQSHNLKHSNASSGGGGNNSNGGARADLDGSSPSNMSPASMGISSPVLSNGSPGSTPNSHCLMVSNSPLDPHHHQQQNHHTVNPFSVDSLVTSRESPTLLSGNQHHHPHSHHGGSSTNSNSCHVESGGPLHPHIHHHSHHHHASHPMNYSRAHTPSSTSYTGGAGSGNGGAAPYCPGALHYGLQQEDIQVSAMNTCLSGGNSSAAAAAAAHIAMTMSQGPGSAAAAVADQYSRTWYAMTSGGGPGGGSGNNPASSSGGTTSGNSSANNSSSGIIEHHPLHDSPSFDRHSSSVDLFPDAGAGSPCPSSTTSSHHLGFRNAASYRSYYSSECSVPKYWRFPPPNVASQVINII